MRAIKNIALSLFITAIIVLSAFFTRGIAPGPWKYIRLLGLYPYAMIFFALWSLLVSLSNDWKLNRLSILPCFFGVFGFLQAQYSNFYNVSDYMSSSGELESTYGMVGAAMFGVQLSFKILILGIGLSLLLFTLSTCVRSCRSPIKE